MGSRWSLTSSIDYVASPYYGLCTSFFLPWILFNSNRGNCYLYYASGGFTLFDCNWFLSTTTQLSVEGQGSLCSIPRYESSIFTVWLPRKYRIYSNKRHGAYLIFRAISAALIRGWRLFKHCSRQIYFFIQRYTFYLFIFLWTDTKVIVNLQFREKFTQWKKPESFMITRAKISAGAALIRGWRLLAFLSEMQRLFEGSA